MAEEKKDKDPKSLYHWDDDSGEVEEEVKTPKKKSKKVARREAKEKAKRRKKEKIKELQKTRITKKGKIWIAIGSSLLAVIVVLALMFFYFGIGFDLTKKLVVFDGMKVTQKEVDVYIDFLESQNPGAMPPKDDPQYEILETNIMDSIIVLKVLRKYGDENEISVTDAEVDEEISAVISNYPSEEDFEKDLADRDISRSFLREQISDQLLRDKIFKSITEDVKVSEEEAKEYYEENKETLFKIPEQKKVSHILIKFNVPEGETINDEVKKEAMQKIEDIEKKLNEGEDFAELAKEYSEDELSAENEGEIGFISEGQTVPEFEEAVFDLEVGEVSPIVETYYGYHIIKVLEEKDSYIESFDDVRETIEDYLTNEKQVNLWQDFVYSLLDDVEIEYKTDLKGNLLEDLSVPRGSTDQ